MLLSILQIAGLLVLTAPAARADTHIPTTTYSSNVTWTAAGSPYILDGTVTVAAGATLTIEPGVVVKLNGTFRKIIVNGTLHAVGTSGSGITFTSYQDDSIGGDSNGDGGATSGQKGQWSDISIRAGTASVLDYVTVRYGGVGSANSAYGAVTVHNADVTLTIDHANITENQRSGVRVSSGCSTACPGAKISNTVLFDNGNGVSVNHGWVDITKSTIQTQSIGVWFNFTSSFAGPASSITDTDITGGTSAGVRLGVDSAVPTANWPHGTRNNIYGNAGKQIDTLSTNRDVKWVWNFFGTNVGFAYNDSKCLSENVQSLGELKYFGSSDGPIRSSSYIAGDAPDDVLCDFDRIKIDPWEFSPTYIDGTGAASGQLMGAGVHATNPSGTQADPVNSATGSFLTQVTDLSLAGIGVPFRLTRSYNSLDSTSSSLGRGWRHSFAAELVVQPHGDMTLIGEDGQRVEYEKQADGSFVGPRGAGSTLATVTGGYELTRKDQVVYRFDDNGKLLSIKDRNEQGVTLAYGGDATLDTVTDSVGRVITFTHDPTTGLLTNVALPDGRDVTYGYTNGLLTSVTDVRDNTTTYTYHSYHSDTQWLQKIIDQNSNTVVNNTYSTSGASAGRVISQLDARNNLTSYSWNPTTQTATMTDARTNPWKDVYSSGRLVERIDPLNHSFEFSYDSDLNVTGIVDPRGNETTITYDPRGNITSITAPAPFSHTQTLTYNADNDVTSYENGRGNLTEFEYDAAGNLDLIRQPGSIVTDIHRQAGTGLIDWIKDPRLKTTNFEYTGGNLTAIVRPSGARTTMGYDTSGRMTTLVEARGNEPGATPADFTWEFDYDAANHIVSATSPLGHTTTWSWDPAGNLDSTTDAKLRVIDYQHFPNNLLKKVIPPGTPAAETIYDYDAVGNLISRTDANAHTTTFGYSAANLLESVVLPQGRTWSYTYDNSGNLKTVVNAEGNNTPGDPNDGMVTYGYDELNRLTAIDYSDSTPDVSYTYDANSNRATMVDQAGTESYGYDALDRLTSVTRGSDSFGYEYDPSSQVTKRTYPDGTVVDYTYTDDGYLDTVVSGGSTLVDYAYNPAGMRTALTLPSANGHVENRSYDRDGRLEWSEHVKGASTLSKFTYLLDELGNPTRVTDKDGAVVSFAYDPDRDFLIEACYQASCPGASDPFIRWEYDGVGNRTKEVRPTVTTDYVYDASDRLGTATPSDQAATTYAWDRNGNMTGAGSRTFTYDLADRMVSTTGGGQTVTYAYDGDGKRLSASVSGGAPSATGYVWDVNWPLPQQARESDGSGSLLRRYVHGNDLLSMTTGGSNYYFHHDGLGSVTNVTSAAGAEQWRYAYEPFGTPLSSTMVDPSAPANPMRFTGELLDSETGLYHLRARQMDPSLGSFAARDPWPPHLYDAAISPYLYANARPTVLIDPSGLFTIGWCWGGQLGGGLFHFGGSLCLVGSSSGQLGVTATGSAEVSTGAEASLFNGPQFSTGHDIQDLTGPFAVFGASVGEGIIGGIDTFAGPGHCGQVVAGATGQVGGGFHWTPPAIPGEVHGGVSATKVWQALGPPPSPCLGEAVK
jgi:RHS repeat-associated protein